MKTGRGYIIRYYSEDKGKSLFYRSGSGHPWASKLGDTTVFTDHTSATDEITKFKYIIGKRYRRGYYYVSKCFYKEINGGFRGTVLRATKLTKPDRHDFLEAI